ncbi:MAG: HAD hydrolase-like protein, partial [Spirochaetaceae bacterium]|nr:HAD hydrolase-like protein [Spirochaetaceae bacterium]
MIKAILFDNDGTLSDSVTAVIEATNKVLTTRGFTPCSDEEIIDGMRVKTSERMLMHARAERNDENLGTALANDYYTAFFSIIGIVKLFDGITGCLESLLAQGFIMGIVSNNATDIVETVLTQNRIRSYFSIIIGE